GQQRNTSRRRTLEEVLDAAARLDVAAERHLVAISDDGAALGAGALRPHRSYVAALDRKIDAVAGAAALARLSGARAVLNTAAHRPARGRGRGRRRCGRRRGRGLAGAPVRGAPPNAAGAALAALLKAVHDHLAAAARGDRYGHRPQRRSR